MDGDGFAEGAALTPILPTADEAADLAAPAIALEAAGRAAAGGAAAAGAGGAGGAGRDGTMADNKETRDVRGADMPGVGGPLSVMAETFAARPAMSASDMALLFAMGILQPSAQPRPVETQPPV